jgi:hypothetical protein
VIADFHCAPPPAFGEYPTQRFVEKDEREGWGGCRCRGTLSLTFCDLGGKNRHAFSATTKAEFMNDLDWLIGHRFQEVIRHEYRWEFVFDGGANVTSGCLWRLIENGGIRVTNEDDGHPFGLPAPVDAVIVVNERLVGATITSVVLEKGTLDLEIRFSTGHAIQVIPTSSAYEAWEAYEPPRQFIACGGGDLVVFGSEDRVP